MTVIYADTVFLMNTALDYLLLRACGILTATPLSRLRLLGAAGAGGLYAVAVFLPLPPVVQAPGVRLLWSLVLTGLAFGVRRGLLRRWGVFLALSGALAGMVVLVSCLPSAELTFPRGVPVTRMDAKALLLAGTLGCWVCDALLGRLTPARGRELLPVRLYWDGREAALTALADSGNLLTDDVGRPVLVAEAGAVASLLPERVEAGEWRDPARCFARYAPRWGPGRLRLLPCQSLGMERGLLLALRTDRAVYPRCTVQGQMVALSPAPLSGGQYQGVVNPTELQEGYHGLFHGGNRSNAVSQAPKA